MSRKSQAMKAALKVILSAMMALPMPSFAKFGDTESVPAVTMDGPPVIVQEVFDQNGQMALFTALPVSPEQELEIIDKMGRLNPDGFHLGVSGPEDPALKAAAKTGYLKRMKAYVVGDEDQLPMMQGLSNLSYGAREKIKSKMRELSVACRKEWKGLLSAITYSGIIGTSVWLTSNAVKAGVGIFSVVSAWNAFILLKPHAWSAAIARGGDAGRAVLEWVAGKFGHRISDMDIRLYEMLGRFAVTFAVSAVQVALVRAAEGKMAFLSRGSLEAALEDLAYITFHGIKNNYSIWDHVVLDKYKDGKISEEGVSRYLTAQFVLGGLLELASYQSHSQYEWLQNVSVAGTVVLIGLTASGVLYQLLNIDQQERLKNAPVKVGFVLRNGFIQATDRRDLVIRKIGSIKNRLAKNKRNQLSNCEQLMLDFDSRKGNEEVQKKTWKVGGS